MKKTVWQPLVFGLIFGLLAGLGIVTDLSFIVWTQTRTIWLGFG